MAKRSLGKWALIPQEESFLVGALSWLISPWIMVWYFCNKLGDALIELSEDLQALADQRASLILTKVRIEAIAVGMINFRSLTPNLSIQSQK